MNRISVLVALATLAGCSFDIKQLQHPYDERTAPRCEPSDIAPAGDLLAGGILVLGGIALAAVPAREPDPDSVLFDPPNRNTWTKERVGAGIGLAAIGAVWGLIGYAGLGWNKECYDAIEQWDARQIAQDEHLQPGESPPPPARNPKNVPQRASTYWCSSRGCFADRVNCRGAGCLKQKAVWCAVDDDGFYSCARNRHDCLVEKHRSRNRMGECVEQTAALPDETEKPKPVVPPATPPVAPPRGFFCSSGTCAREKAMCEQARIAASDATSCTLVESAFCFSLAVGGESCAPNADACAQRKTVAGDAASGDCSERK